MRLKNLFWRLILLLLIEIAQVTINKILNIDIQIKFFLNDQLTAM